MERTVLQSNSAHHFIGYQCKHGKHTGALNLRPREGVSVGVWKQTREDTLVMVGTPTEHKDRPIDGRRRSSLGREKGLAPVRAKMPNATLIKEIKPGMCRVVYVNQTDVGGHVGGLVRVRKIYVYFCACCRAAPPSPFPSCPPPNPSYALACSCRYPLRS
jgi:hypothetical protein